MNSEPNTTARLETDLDLVKRAQEGDTDAFASLFYSHKARIYSVCLRMTNNTAEAEDLTQDAFLQVFRKLGSFRGDSALVYVALSNRCEHGPDALPQEGP